MYPKWMLIDTKDYYLKEKANYPTHKKDLKN